MQNPGNSVNHLFIDATAPVPPPRKGDLNLGGKNPAGREIGITNRWLTLDGKPWFPVMGEFHFSRYPAEFWEDELLKMKSAGITMVASYVFWIHHEEREGGFDWSGRRNIRGFVELCRKHGLYFYLRPGPWVHGECRNGGLPDWIPEKCGPEVKAEGARSWGPARGRAVRRNDPEYLGFVSRYFRELSRELAGLFWRDGGPIVGIQIENEYWLKGPDAGRAHILRLKELAKDAGMDAPLWSVTGWGDVEYPEREVFATFGMYPDHFWDGGMEDLPQDGRSMFRAERNDPGIGSDHAGPGKAKAGAVNEYLYPYTTCELGAGIQVSYRRRPFIHPEQAASMITTRLGSGVKMLGYYVFHGGTNPAGRYSTMHESQATNYWSDVPVLSYDFQTAISEYGQVREVAHALRPLHVLLRDFGEELALSEAAFPSERPQDWDDLRVLRAAARMKGDSGFLFVTNYQRFLPLPERESAQVELSTPGGKIRVPDEPVRIPSGAFFIWPIRMDVSAGVLRYATAQPLCRVEGDGMPHFFFKEIPGVEPEFAFEKAGLKLVETAGRKEETPGSIRVRGLKSGSGRAITVEGVGGKRAGIVLLDDERGKRCYRAKMQGRERVLHSPADPLIEPGRVRLRSRDASGLSVSIFPAPEGGVTSPGARLEESPDGIFTRYSSPAAPAAMIAKLEQTREAGLSVPPRMGSQGEIEAPLDEDYSRAAAWRVSFEGEPPANVSEVFLAVDYRGDAARVFVGGLFVADDYYNGRLWEFGLRRMDASALRKGLEILILPLRRDVPIYIDKAMRPSFDARGEALELRRVEVIPEYEAEIVFG